MERRAAREWGSEAAIRHMIAKVVLFIFVVQEVELRTSHMFEHENYH